MTSTLFSVHGDVLNATFSGWIDVPTLAMLDTSICNSEIRPQFLELISSDQFMQSNATFCNCNTLYLKWLVLRDLAVRKLSMEDGEQNGINDEFFSAAKLLAKQKGKLRYLKINRFRYLQEIVDLVNGCIDELSFMNEFRGDHLNNTDLNALLPLLRNLKGLGLNCVGDFRRDEFLHEVATHLTNLEYLSIKFYNPPVGAVSLLQIVRNNKKLSSLVFPTGTTNETFLSAIACCPLLKHVELSECYEITDKTIIRLPEFCPHITSLVITVCSESINGKAFVQLIKHYPALTHLDVSECEVDDFLLLGLATHCKQLTSFTAAESCSFTNAGFVALSTNCPLLAKFYIERCEEVSDIGVLSFAKNCRQLEVFSIADCDRVTDLSIFQLIENCEYLSHLNVSGTRAYGSAAKFAAGCDQLFFNAHYGKHGIGFTRIRKANGHVEVAFHYHDLSHSMMETIAFSCPGVKRLRISDGEESEPQSDECFCNMIKSLPLLEDFQLVGGSGATRAVVQCLARHCEHLSSIELESLSGFQDDDLIELLGGGRRFKKISIADCELLTDACVPHMRNHCEYLEELNVKDCKISKRSVLSLVQSSTKLRKLVMDNTQSSADLIRSVMSRNINLFHYLTEDDETAHGHHHTSSGDEDEEGEEDF